MSYTQTNRRIAITTPLGKDVLMLRGFTGTEAISRLFQFDLDLLSENDSVKFQDVVGKNVTLRIFDADGAETCFQRAVEVARRQAARTLELRATMSLARLWRSQGRAEEGRGLVEDAYREFTEGFDTPDLRDAAALVRELRR